MMLGLLILLICACVAFDCHLAALVGVVLLLLCL